MDGPGVGGSQVSLGLVYRACKEGLLNPPKDKRLYPLGRALNRTLGINGHKSKKHPAGLWLKPDWVGGGSAGVRGEAQGKKEAE